MAQTIVLQTTVSAATGWHAGRFARLRAHLAALRDDDGAPRYDVVARDRTPGVRDDDPVLAGLAGSGVAQLWLLGVDADAALTPGDVRGIAAFRRRGGGLLTARNARNLARFEPSPELASIAAVNRSDAQATEHRSGADGDYQFIDPVRPVHPLLRSLKAPAGVIRWFPAHPHEGMLDASACTAARAIASGTDGLTGQTFALAVAIENETMADGGALGRVVCTSTFRHVADYNWDVRSDRPKTAADPPGDGIAQDPRPLDIFKDYVTNVARWLAPA